MFLWVKEKQPPVFIITLETRSILFLYIYWNTISSVWNSYFQKIFQNFKATAWYWALLHPITVANSVCTAAAHTKTPQVCWWKPSAGGVSSLQSVPFLGSFYLVLCLFLSLFHLAQWRSAISTTLIQSQPACQSRQDTTPTAILSPLITYTLCLLAFSLLLSPFSPLSLPFPLSPLPPPHFSPFPFSISWLCPSPFLRLPHFYFPLSLFLLSLLSPSIFPSCSLSPSPTYGRIAAQAQGNGINFHSRLNSQSISLELNTLPPIRKSQGSISPFPRRHSPAIQRQPRQPCLTFWRCMRGDWTGAPACCSFPQAVQRTWQTSKDLRTTQLAAFEYDAHLHLWHSIQIVPLRPVDFYWKVMSDWPSF